MSKDLDAFTADVERQLGAFTPKQWRARFPKRHLYALYGRYRSCVWCGKVELHEGVTPSPCPGG